MRLKLVNVDDETLGLDACQWPKHLSDEHAASLPRRRRCWQLRQAWLLGWMDLMDAMMIFAQMISVRWISLRGCYENRRDEERKPQAFCTGAFERWKARAWVDLTSWQTAISSGPEPRSQPSMDKIKVYSTLMSMRKSPLVDP